MPWLVFKRTWAANLPRAQMILGLGFDNQSQAEELLSWDEIQETSSAYAYT
jgi:hypothetical protein